MALIFDSLLLIYISSRDNKTIKIFASKVPVLVNLFLSRVFTPVLPIFILEFILKAQHDGSPSVLFKKFVPLLSVIIVLYISYIGFSSMSSVAATPVLIDEATKNLKCKELTKRISTFKYAHDGLYALAIPHSDVFVYC